MKQPWLMLADAAHAKIFAFHGHFSDLTLLDDGQFEHINVRSQDLVTNKRGRVSNGTGDAKSAIERQTDPHEHEKEVFAKSLMQHLHQHLDEFSSLVIVAPPKMLGYLRSNISKGLNKKIVAEVPKDLLNNSTEEVVSILSTEFDKDKWASLQISHQNL